MVEASFARRVLTLMVVVNVTARDDTSQDGRDSIEVVLIRPLGDRAVIDGSTRQPVRVGASSE